MFSTTFGKLRQILIDVVKTDKPEIVKTFINDPYFVFSNENGLKDKPICPDFILLSNKQCTVEQHFDTRLTEASVFNGTRLLFHRCEAFKPVNSNNLGSTVNTSNFVEPEREVCCLHTFPEIL